MIASPRADLSSSPDASAAAPGPAPTASSAPVTDEIRGAARGGAVTLVGSATSAAMGFLVVLVLAQQLGARGSGIVLQGMAAFMIGLSMSRLGMDTTAVWIVPRLKLEAPDRVRGACVALLAWTAAAGAVVASGWWLVAGVVAPGAWTDSPVAQVVSAIAWALPLASVMLVALAATRGFGGVLPFNLIGNILLPVSRPAVILLLTATGGSVVAAALGWAAAVVPAMALALGVLARQVLRFERRAGITGRWRPTRADQRRLLSFGLPRTLSAMLEQSIIWFDVLLVGILAGAAAAGTYGAASRFVAAGVIVLTALRIVVAPRFSALLAADDRDRAQELYSATATWILLLGAPIYLTLAWFSPTLLAWLGPDFGDGVAAMVVLCLGGLALLAGGNVQSLLLMSGRSGWGAVNKLVVFVTNVVGNLILIPWIGLLGAALMWAFCMVLDTTLAAVQVRRFTGIRPAAGRLGVVLAATACCASVPAVVGIALFGRGGAGLATSVLLTIVLLGGYAALDRRRLHLDDLFALVSRR